jgi:hypothetical protein
MIIRQHYLTCSSLYVCKDKNNNFQLSLHMGKGLYEKLCQDEYNQGEEV